MNPSEAHDIFQRIRVVREYINEQEESYPKTVAQRALREVAKACQEAMIVRTNDTDRCDPDNNQRKKVADGGYLAG